MIRLADARAAKHLTQEQLADKVGLTQQAISSYERGTASPSVPTAKLIAGVLDLDWTDFFAD